MLLFGVVLLFGVASDVAGVNGCCVVLIWCCF